MNSLTEKEITDLMTASTIVAGDNGISNWPGEMMRLDTEQIQYGEKLGDMELLAWYELTKDGNPPARCNQFIIETPWTYFIVDHFYQAVAIWNFLMKQYEPK